MELNFLNKSVNIKGKHLFDLFIFIAPVLILFLTTNLNAQAPTITSFAPPSAKPGDVVTIVDTGFNTTSASNIVFFGATKALVTAATATNMTVTVPSGATYAPITILNTRTVLTAYSLANFNPIYSPAKTALITSDFNAKVDFTTGTEPISVVIGDLDGDGKPYPAAANFIENQ